VVVAHLLVVLVALVVIVHPYLVNLLGVVLLLSHHLH
jgi:hypothetical protein